jgi:hypothetical protein
MLLDRIANTMKIIIGIPLSAMEMEAVLDLDVVYVVEVYGIRE